MRPGITIDDRFVIEREVRSGGMGAVYRARDVTTGETVALKALLAGAELARFEQEARLLSALDHPRIARYVAHGVSRSGELDGDGPGEEEACPYLAMEWLEGEDLEARLARGPLPMAEAVVVALQVAEALEAAHAQGIVHRDLKPANLFLVGGAFDRIKVLDFGIAKSAEAKGPTRSGIVIGTPGYMAPEQVRGEPSIDARADLFSLGCVLFECLTGQAAFAGEDVMARLARILFTEAPRVSELASEVPPALDKLVARMLAKRPAERPSDAREVALELQALAGSPRSPRPSPARELRAPRAALSATEQHVVSVVVLAAAEAADAATQVAGAAPRSEKDAVSAVARWFGITVERLIDGSIVMTLAGAGVATDQAARAAACALALCAAVPDARVALATGRALAGHRLPMGEAIDRAALLLRRPRPSGGGVRIDAVTAGLLDERFGRSSDPDGIVLVGHRDADDARLLLGQATPFVGRDGELATLEALLEQCVQEPLARAVVVTAPAGAGKSRLRRELVASLLSRPDRVEVWTARGDPVGAGGAFGLAVQMLRRAAGILEGEHLATRQEKLRARIERHVAPASASRVVEFLGEMIGTPFPDEGNVPLRAARQDAILMGDQLRRAWEDLVEAETAAHPLLIVLEDMHWGDRPTVGLVDAALRLFPERPLMVLALARPEVDERFAGLWKDRSVQRMALAPLPRRAAARLVRSVLGAQVPEERVARLVEHAAGNAFTLEELVRAEADGRGDALPETVLAMVEVRLEAQGPEARRVLRAASVFGREFWAGGVAALVGGEEKRGLVEPLLEGLVRRELLTRHGASRFGGQTEYEFRHAIVREAAYAMLTDTDRTLGHSLAARWLEGVGEADPMVLAEHLERGGDGKRAVREYARAAKQALEGNDFGAAISRVDLGVQAGAEGEMLGELLLARAEAHRWRGESAEVAAAATQAMRLFALGSDGWGDAARCFAPACISLGDVDRLVRLARDLLARIRAGAPSAGCLRGAGVTAVHLLFAGQREVGAELLAAAEEAGAASHADPSVRARVHGARGLLAQQAGNPGEYLEHFAASAAAFEDAGAVRIACATRVDLGFALAELGSFVEAEASLRGALVEAERMGLDGTASMARQNLGWVLHRMGRLDEALVAQRAAAAAALLRGNRRMEGGARVYLAATLLAMGALDAAEEQARSACRLLVVAPPLRPGSLAVLAHVLLRAVRPAEAIEVTREAMEALDALGGSIEEHEGLLRLVHAEALDATGAHDEARRVIAAARARILERAAKITSGRWRTSFLEDIAEHSRTLALAAAWLGESR